MKIKLFSYNQLDTMIHQLSGLTKFICFLLLTTTVMLSFDLRVILFVTILSFVLLKVAQIKFKQIRLVFLYVLLFLISNFILTYLFAPEYGVSLYGTRHEIFRFFGNYTVTLEQFLYQITKFMKYLSVVPLGMIFFLTTDPSEFSSSLNKVGVSYKACTALSLTLRYFPDIQRDYSSISLAQQARGLDMSHKAKLSIRLKNTLKILLPLIFTTLDRIESISNAMELRGYGKNKKRTWYSFRPLQKADILSMGVCLLIFVASILIIIFVDHGVFWNPFL